MEIIVKTLFGLEEVLAGELRELGVEELSVRNRAVTFKGDMESVYTVNYMCRTALSVLVKVSSFKINRANELYDKALKCEWKSIMTADDTFSVVSVANSPLFKHTNYPGLLVKDAIADYFRKHSGRRPSVDSAHPRIVVNLHVSNNDATISVDSTVLPLFKRGYRKMQGRAPLNEALAAGIIKMTGWNGESNFHDPMCGSGTLPVEAGMIAAAIPPGYLREFYGFRNWQNYDNDLFESIKNRFNSKIRPVPVMISGADISMQAVRAARECVVNAGLAGEVRIYKEDFSVPVNTAREGMIVFNPPYGKRIIPDEMNEFYSKIGDVLKNYYTGCEAWILSGAPESLKMVGLKPSAKIKLLNGSVECRLNRYHLMKGSYDKRGLQ